MFIPRAFPRLSSLVFLFAVLLAIAPRSSSAQEAAQDLPAPPLAFDRESRASAAPIEAAAPAVVAGGDANFRLYLPAIAGRASEPASEPVAGVQRSEAETLYRTHFLPYQTTAAGWTGNIGNCAAGTLSAQYTDAMALLVNYYRKMAGVQAITFDGELNGKSQAAALMMSANRALSHTPPSSWRCYSNDGAAAAGSSNLALYGGYDASYHGITMQMEDGGDGNWFVGHRRWILYPQTQHMGIGQIPPDDNTMAATVLWVFDPEHLWDARPPVRDDYVAWPSPGYAPAPTVYSRWSYSHSDADFSRATVTMQMDGASVPVADVKYDHEGYGEHTLIWTPQLGSALTDGKEHRITVTVGNVERGGAASSSTYTVILFDPDA